MITAGMVTCSPITLICVFGLHDKISVTERLQRKGQQWQHEMNWTLHIHQCCCGGRRERIQDRSCDKKREEWGKGVFRFGFISYYTTLIWLTLIKLISSQVFFVRDSNRWMISLFPISAHEIFVIISLHCPAENGSDRGVLVIWHHVGVNPSLSVKLTFFE